MNDIRRAFSTPMSPITIPRPPSRFYCRRMVFLLRCFEFFSSTSGSGIRILVRRDAILVREHTFTVAWSVLVIPAPWRLVGRTRGRLSRAWGRAASWRRWCFPEPLATRLDLLKMPPYFLRCIVSVDAGRPLVHLSARPSGFATTSAQSPTGWIRRSRLGSRLAVNLEVLSRRKSNLIYSLGSCEFAAIT